MSDQPAGPPPEEAANKLPFDKAALEKLRGCINECLTEHPELRSVVVVLDYHGTLNNSDVDKGIWIGTDGSVIRPEAVFGSIDNTMKILEVMFGRSVSMVEGIKEQAHVVMHELRKRRTESEQE